MSNFKTISSGVFWTSIEVIINKSFGFLIKLFLARVLFPEDYGLVGMAVVFTSFISVFNDLGMGTALIQRKSNNLTDLHYHTSFWTAVVWATFIFLIVSIGIAPLAAWFYDEKMLIKIIPVLSIGILASPINLVHKAQLTKALSFKKIAIINNVSNIISGVASLILAYIGFGVWALVFNSVSVVIIAMPLFFKATKWLPKFRWGRKEFSDIFGFGAYTTGTQLFNQITNQIDYLLVGKLIGASALGMYSFAFILTSTFRSQLSGILGKVMYPVYAELQNSPVKLKNYFLKVVHLNAQLVFPVMFGLILFAENLIPLIFGEKWLKSVFIVQILAAAVLVQMTINSHTTLLRAYGLVKLELYLQLFKSIFLFVPAIVFGTYYYGIYGTAIAYLVAKILSTVVSCYYLNKYLDIGLESIFKSLISPIVLNLIPFSIVWLCMFFLKINWALALSIYTVLFLFGIILFAKDDLQYLKKIRK